VNLIANKLEAAPALARVVPFAAFVVLTFCQGKFGVSSAYWFYLGKTVVGAWLIWTVRPFVTEMRWKFSWGAAVVGVAVFAMWIAVDGFCPSLDQLLGKVGLARTKSAAERATEFWNPEAYFGEHSMIAWLLMSVRVVGMSWVVPPLEEVFYRSFVYRYLIRTEFLSVPLGRFAWRPFLFASVLFGFEHNEWLAGILCGFAYQGLVCWKKRLGDAMTAHAITNFLLGLWVVWRGAWHFW
jgi:CAAX prenyl protease-like protein